MDAMVRKASRAAAPNWDDLRIFLEVARHGSVHAASRQLGLDHSTVCRRIGRLETLLAVKLLHERIHRLQRVGLALCAVAVALVAASGRG